jgi:DNA-binding FadR family transcriptional regulator
MMLDKIYTPKTAEIVASRIRGQILRGQIREGEALPNESVMVDQLGVSRPTLREAFRLLEAEGLIVVRRGARGGATIVTPAVTATARQIGLLLQYRRATVADIFHARTLIEAPAAALLAERATAEIVQSLSESLEAEGEALDDPLAFSTRSTSFHEHVVQLSGSPTLGVFDSILAEIIRCHTERVVLSRSPDPAQPSDARRAHRAHAKLIELVDARDARGAEQFWHRHLTATIPFLLHTMPDQTVLDLFD